MHEDLDSAPTCLVTNEKISLVAIGFKEGIVNLFFLENNISLKLISKVSINQEIIKSLYCVPEHNFVLSFG